MPTHRVGQEQQQDPVRLKNLLAEAFDRLQNQDIPELIVIHGNKIVGLLRRKDIVRWLEL